MSGEDNKLWRTPASRSAPTAQAVSKASATCVRLKRQALALPSHLPRHCNANCHAATSSSTAQDSVDKPRPSRIHSYVRSGEEGHRPTSTALSRNTTSSLQ